MIETTRQGKTSRSSLREFSYNSNREIKKDEKLTKNMDKYTKSLCDFKIKIKLEKDEEGLKKLENNLNYMQKSNDNLHLLHSKDNQDLQNKSKEITYLNTNIDNCLNANEELKSYINNLFKKRKFLESDQKAIADYCNDLKKKFKNIESTIEEYQKEVNGMKSDNDKILMDYEDNIAQMTRENEDLLDTLKLRQGIHETQNNQIRELDIRTNILIKDIEDQKNYYSERETLNQIKYDELNKKYNALLKKVYEFQVNEDIKRLENGRINVRSPNKTNYLKEEYNSQIHNLNVENAELNNKLKQANMEVMMQQTYLEHEAVDKKTFRASSFKRKTN